MSNQTHARHHVRHVLDELGRSLDIDLTLDDDDACFFEHQDGWHMAILLPDEQQIVTAVSVLSNVSAPDEDIWPALVEFGWVGAHTGGAALSWNPESRSFVLWYSRDVLSTTADELNALLLKLCQAVAVIRPALSDSVFSRSAPDAARTPAHSMVKV